MPTHTVDRAPLLDTVSRVSRSASRDESRPVLTGILVRFEGDALVMAATDSYRLAVKETALEGGGLDLEAIVPARALGELARIATEGDSIELGAHENQAAIGQRDEDGQGGQGELQQQHRPRGAEPGGDPAGDGRPEDAPGGGQRDQQADGALADADLADQEDHQQ